MTTNASHPKMAFFRFSALQCAARAARLRAGVTMDLPFGAGGLPSANPYLATSLGNASRPVLSAESCRTYACCALGSMGARRWAGRVRSTQLVEVQLNVAGK